MRGELWTFGSWALIELSIERNTKDLYHSPSDLRRSDIETRECLSPFCQFNQKRMLKTWKDPLPAMSCLEIASQRCYLNIHMHYTAGTLPQV